MQLIEKNTYGFEDVSLEPAACSSIKSRRDIDTSYKLNDKITLATPIIASPMADVCDDNVAIAIAKAGGLGCIHRFQSVEDQVKMVITCKSISSYQVHVLGAIGVQVGFEDRAEALAHAGVDGFFVDVAFLNERTLQVCKWMRKRFPDLYLISGNVATGAGFRQGVDVGLDAIRVGIGNGQACRTSRVTGVGVGLVTSLIECYEEAYHADGRVAVICDGGMDTGGSFCKAMAAGAHLAIMGRAFAATDEGPGLAMARTTDFVDGILAEHEGMAMFSDEQLAGLKHRNVPIFKQYRGSASMEAQMVVKARGDIVTSEGVAALVKVYGSVADVLGRFNGALRSSMSYLGANNLDEFRSNAIFRLVSQGVFNQQKARSLQTFEVTV